MKAHLLTVDYEPFEFIDAEPQCGKDFCDACGDCLDCYRDDACRNGGVHVWAVYADQVDNFRARMGLRS